KEVAVRVRALTTSIITLVFLAGLAVSNANAAPRQASSTDSGVVSAAGGVSFDQATAPTPVMPTGRIIDGKAYPPANAPIEVQKAIWAGNEIVGKPYKYGGGHARVKDTGYDCSGTVS